jgi:hypothetical protein
MYGACPEECGENQPIHFLIFFVCLQSEKKNKKEKKKIVDCISNE